MNSQNWQDTATSVDGQTAEATRTEAARTEAAKTEARELGNQTAEAGQHVAGVAKDEVREVAHEAKAQVRSLAGELGSDLKAQAGAQQQRLSEGLRTVSEELQNMAAASNSGGTAGHLVEQVASRVGEAAGWLENREPGALLDEVKSFARQRPGVFLAVAAGAGLLAGRLTRGLAGGNDAAGQAGAAAASSASPAASPAAPLATPSAPVAAPLVTTPAPVMPPPVLPASETAAGYGSTFGAPADTPVGHPVTDPLTETVVDGPGAPTPGNDYPSPSPSYPTSDPHTPRVHRPEEG